MDAAGVLGGVAVGLCGLAGLRVGWLTWRGIELRSVGLALQHPEQRHTLHLGGRTLYQTWHGAGAAMLAGGPALVLLGFGLALVSVVAPGEEPGWWWAVSVIGAALLVTAALYLAAYFWTGVPDGLRPPAQRGQPGPGGIDAEGRPGPLERLLATPGPVDLGTDPTRPPWSRGDPEWTAHRPRPRVGSSGEPW